MQPMMIEPCFNFLNTLQQRVANEYLSIIRLYIHCKKLFEVLIIECVISSSMLKAMSSSPSTPNEQHHPWTILAAGPQDERVKQLFVCSVQSDKK